MPCRRGTSPPRPAALTFTSGEFILAAPHPRGVSLLPVKTPSRGFRFRCPAEEEEQGKGCAGVSSTPSSTCFWGCQSSQSCWCFPWGQEGSPIWHGAVHEVQDQPVGPQHMAPHSPPAPQHLPWQHRTPSPLPHTPQFFPMGRIRQCPPQTPLGRAAPGGAKRPPRGLGPRLCFSLQAWLTRRSLGGRAQPRAFFPRGSSGNTRRREKTVGAASHPPRRVPPFPGRRRASLRVFFPLQCLFSRAVEKLKLSLWRRSRGTPRWRGDPVGFAPPARTKSPSAAPAQLKDAPSQISCFMAS